MSAVLIGVLVAGYVALLVLVLCVLTMAKRADQRIPGAGEAVDAAPAAYRPRQDLGLALTDVDAAFVRRFDRRASAREYAGGRVPPRAA
jgi:hypothetical protein